MHDCMVEMGLSRLEIHRGVLLGAGTMDCGAGHGSSGLEAIDLATPAAQLVSRLGLEVALLSLREAV